MPHKDPIARAAYMKAYQAKHREDMREYMRVYNARPDVKARPHYRSPETKERARLARQTPEARAKLHARHLRFHYNITLEQREEMWTRQQGLCGVCKKPLKRDRSTHTDHDHRTERFRGLLHTGCNTGLANVENEEFRNQCLAYLEATSGPR